jgi:hypothetical protein
MSTRQTTSGILCLLTVLLSASAGCAFSPPASLPDASFEKAECLKTFEVLKKLLGEKDYDRAYMLFTDEYKKKRAPSAKDFAAMAEHDGAVIIKSAVQEADEDFDAARAVVSYGDRYIYVHFARLDEFAGVGGIWHITTRDHYRDLIKRSSPEKTLVKTLSLLRAGKYTATADYFTPYARTHFRDMLEAVYVFSRCRNTAPVRKHGHWALWARKLDVSSIPKGMVPPGGKGGKQAVATICFIKRSGEWLIAAPDELMRTKAHYGDE